MKVSLSNINTERDEKTAWLAYWSLRVNVRVRVEEAREVRVRVRV